MIKQYYYEKYSIKKIWNKNSSGAVDSETIRNNNVRTENVIDEDYGGVFRFGSGAYTGFKVVSRNIHGYTDYRLALSDWRDPPFKLSDKMYDWGVYYGLTGFYALLEGFITYVDSFGLTHWYIEKIHRLNDTYTIYKHLSKGNLIGEDIIKNASYPKNGIKNGFWWVRGKEYTIPPPTIISPENGYEVLESDSEMPYFVFRLNERQNNDHNKYHARIRLGFRSDFLNYKVMLQSKDDQSNWEYYNGSSWQPFPADGVNANTRVRVKPDIKNFEFGFYYWDCTAYHPFWNYGVDVDHRLIAVIKETNEVYFLTIAGRRYQMVGLNVSRSSNGELGSIEIRLPNHNV